MSQILEDKDLGLVSHVDSPLFQRESARDSPRQKEEGQMTPMTRSKTKAVSTSASQRHWDACQPSIGARSSRY